MNDSKLRKRLVTALASLSQIGDKFDIFDLAAACGGDFFQVLRGLDDLASRGLADRRRVRLTLSGLAVAAALGAVRSSAARDQRESARPPARTRCAA